MNTLPQKLKRLAAHEELTQLHDDILARVQSENATPDEILVMIKLSKYLSQLQPLIEALIDCVEAAKLFASFAPKGPVPEGLCPSFYHTLNYADEVKLQERIDAGREALTALEKLSGDGV